MFESVMFLIIYNIFNSIYKHWYFSWKYLGHLITKYPFSRIISSLCIGNKLISKHFMKRRLNVSTCNITRMVKDTKEQVHSNRDKSRCEYRDQDQIQGQRVGIIHGHERTVTSNTRSRVRIIHGQKWIVYLRTENKKKCKF